MAAALPKRQLVAVTQKAPVSPLVLLYSLFILYDGWMDALFGASKSQPSFTAMIVRARIFFSNSDCIRLKKSLIHLGWREGE